MSKTPFALALLFAFSLLMGGCTVYTTTRPLYVERGTPWQPAYVYTYQHGCWADDVWYAPCPIVPGPSYGYYVYVDGYYHWHGGAVWGYRPGYPPPRHWHGHYGRSPHRWPSHPHRHAPAQPGPRRF